MSEPLDDPLEGLELRASAGDVSAMVQLGERHDFGEGVPVDREKAARWYRAAAAHGNLTAMFNLGVCYSHGEGVPQDKHEAVRWYRAAAELGDEGAARVLDAWGLLYVHPPRPAPAG